MTERIDYFFPHLGTLDMCEGAARGGVKRYEDEQVGCHRLTDGSVWQIRITYAIPYDVSNHSPYCVRITQQ